MEYTSVVPFDLFVQRHPSELDRDSTRAEAFLHRLGQRFSNAPRQYPRGMLACAPDVLAAMTQQELHGLADSVKQGELLPLWDERFALIDEQKFLDVKDLQPCSPDHTEKLLELFYDPHAQIMIYEAFCDMASTHARSGISIASIVDHLEAAGYFGPEPVED